MKRLAETDNIVVLAHELGLERRLLYGWRDAFASGGAGALRRAGRPSKLETIVAALAEQSDGSQAMDPARRIAELERKIGEQQLALDFFCTALRHVREQRRKTGGAGETASTR